MSGALVVRLDGAGDVLLAGPVYETLLSVQLCFYTLALLGQVPAIARRVRPAAGP